MSGRKPAESLRERLILDAFANDPLGQTRAKIRSAVSDAATGKLPWPSIEARGRVIAAYSYMSHHCGDDDEMRDSVMDSETMAAGSMVLSAAISMREIAIKTAIALRMALFTAETNDTPFDRTLAMLLASTLVDTVLLNGGDIELPPETSLPIDAAKVEYWRAEEIRKARQDAAEHASPNGAA